MEEMDSLKLLAPIMIDGEEVTEIPYHFDALTGRDLRDISRSLKKKGVAVSIAALDFDFQQAVFCKAACKCNNRLTEPDILRMSGKDSMRAAGLARAFLMASDPESEELEETMED